MQFTGRGGEPADLLIRAGKIAEIGPGLQAEGVAVEDGASALAVPGLVDAHTHLDNTTWGMGRHVNDKKANLRGRTDYERENRIALGINPVRQPLRHALLLAAMAPPTSAAMWISTPTRPRPCSRIAGGAR